MKTQTRTVLKAFPYSADGKAIETLAAGDQAEIRAELVPGLVKEGYLEPDAKLDAPPAKKPAGKPDAAPGKTDGAAGAQTQAGGQTQPAANK